jgi:hypothetical protein
MLKMKKKCLGCLDKLSNDSLAYICSYECTYCQTCAQDHNHVCKNCGGELKERPKREKSVMDLVVSKFKK